MKIIFNKKIVVFSIFILIAVVLYNLDTHCLADYIQDNRNRWKNCYLDVETPVSVTRWRVPFDTKNRFSIRTVKLISRFGATRYSYVRGHIHTGVDIVPRQKRGRYIYVYPVAPGVICSIHLGHPHRTIVIKHRTSSGNVLYSSYKHLQEIYVSNGEPVHAGTRLARRYTRGEALALGGNYDHLHLEIRKRFDDYGVASWATMNRKELKRRFYDPWIFLRYRMR